MSHTIHAYIITFLIALKMSIRVQTVKRDLMRDDTPVAKKRAKSNVDEVALLHEQQQVINFNNMDVHFSKI